MFIPSLKMWKAKKHIPLFDFGHKEMHSLVKKGVSYKEICLNLFIRIINSSSYN